MEFFPFICSKFMIHYLVLLINFCVPGRQIPSLNPGEIAPPFAIPTLDGRIFYKSQDANSSIPAHPVMFHAYSKYSAFLEAMWRDKHSLELFIEHTPRNIHYVFLTYSGWAERDALWMRKQLHGAIDEYFAGNKKSSVYCHQDTGSVYLKAPKRSNNAYEYNSDLYERNDVKHSFDHVIRKTRMVGLFEVLDRNSSKKEERKRKKRKNEIKEKEPFYFVSRKPNSHKYPASCPKKQAESLKRQLHFVNFPIHELGNWIPYILGHWTCFGVSCALSQVAFKTRSGEIIVVARRLDARYDWLPSPFQLTHMHTSLEVVDYGTACHIKHRLKVKQTLAGFQRWKRNKRKRKRGKVALVSSSGGCSLFEKIKNVAKTDVDTVLIYPKRNEQLKEPRCHKNHCFHPLVIAASMIPRNQGIYIRNMLSRGEKVFVQYQTTPQDNYFFAIDGQGRLAEVGMFLFPSLQFLAYEAKWFNYKTDLIHNVTGSAMVIRVFNHALMKGHKGVTSTIHLPPIKDLLLYRNVELDMALHCPGVSDYSCPHWDHVIHLTICCEKGNSLCGEELGRWISPYRRSIGRWLTNVTPLLPMFTSRTCKLTMVHPFWEKPWKPSLSIRFSDHIKYSKHHYSGKQEDANVVPYEIKKLFQGGKFDKNYNERYSPLHFRVPDWTKRAKLVATITGHGSDDHGCAEFCVTSHHFIFNGHANIRVFKNAATATGCAQRVAEGVEPNEHGTWLYGRDGWCPGQDVVPWVVDVTDQMIEGENRVNYFGLFKGKVPRPKRNPGEIIMNSYLVFYRSAKDIINDT